MCGLLLLRNFYDWTVPEAWEAVLFRSDIQYALNLEPGFEVSQRTIHRDLEALSAARIPVSAVRGAQGGWQLEKGWRTQVPLEESLMELGILDSFGVVELVSYIEGHWSIQILDSEITKEKFGGINKMASLIASKLGTQASPQAPALEG